MPEFSPRLALAWTALVTAGLWLALVLLVMLVPPFGRSIVWPGVLQVLIYGLVLGLFRAVSGSSAREVFALRPASLAVCLVTLLLGFLLQVPATLLTDAVEHFSPTPPHVLAERVSRITPHSSAQGVLIFLVVAGFGPLVEELFFRGALFGALRRGHGLFTTAVTCAFCFALGHMDLRALGPLFVIALAIGEVRELTGSIWPGLTLHAAFNSAALLVVFSGASPNGAPPRMPLAIVLTGCLGSAMLLYWLRSRAEKRASS